MKENLRKGIASVAVAAITISLFFVNLVRIGDEIRSVLAANYGTQTEVGTESVGWVTAYSVSDAITNTVGTVGSSSQTANYSVAGQSGWMCIQSGSSSPNGSTGTVYRCSNTSVFSNDSYLRALSGLTYSQIAVGAYRYASSNPSDNWCVAHTILSYVLSGDGVWYGAVANSRTGGWLSSAASAIRTYASSVSSDAVFYVCVVNGHQNIISLTYTPSVREGKVSINKVDDCGNPVIGACISLTAAGGADVSSLRVVSGTSDVRSIANGIEFTTAGSVVEIQGLQPDSSYRFYEVSAPEGYDLAQEREVSFVTDGNGNPSVAGLSNWNGSTYTYTMVDNQHLTGSVTFKKVEQRTDGTIRKLDQAIIEFRSVEGLDLNTATISMGVGTLVEHNSQYIRFVTGSGDDIDIEIGNLEAGQYWFQEVGTPQGHATAADIYVTVDVNGVCSPSSVTMVDSETQSSPFGSFSLMKVFEAGIDGTATGPNSFFNSVNALNFRMYGPFSEDYIENNPRNLDPNYGNTMYGAAEMASSSDWYGNTRSVTWNPDTNRYEFTVTWTIHGEGAFEGMDVDYHKYYDQETDQWYEWPANGASYMVGLPRNSYFLITENWYSGMISADQNQMLIDSANLSPYWVKLPSADNFNNYAMLIYIGDDGRTYVCDWSCDASIGMINRTALALPVRDGHSVAYYQDHFYGTVSNGTRAGALSLEKIDETGNGVDGVRFELHRAGTGSGYVLARGVPDTGASFVDPSTGYTHYPVNWSFTMTTYDNHTYWDEYVDENGNPDPHQVGWDPRTGPVYEYGQVVGQWEYADHQINANMVYNLNYGDYYIYEFVEDSNGNSRITNYRTPEGWEAVDSNGDGITDYFRKLVTVDSSSHMAPAQVLIANREHSIHVEVAKVDEQTGDPILTGASFELYYDTNGNNEIDNGDILIGTRSTNTEGVAEFNYRLDELPDVVPAELSEYLSGSVNNFLCRESAAPSGYYLNTQTMIATLVESNSYRASFSCTDAHYIDLSFGIDKIDEWTGTTLDGYGGDTDAAFELWVDVNGNGMIDDEDRLLETLTDTDHDGRCDVSYTLSPEVIRDKFPECIDSDGTVTGVSAMNYPTEYIVREISAPHDFYLNNTVFRISLTGRQFAEDATRVIVPDSPYTAQLLVYKLDGDTGDNIANAEFTVYNDVDGDQHFTEGVDTIAQTYTEAEGLHDAGMVWNSMRGCYVSSPLKSGNYVVVETGLPSGYFYADVDGQPSVARNELYFEILGGDISSLTSQEVLEDTYEGTVYNLAPSISTTLHDPVTMSHVAHVGQDCELIDTVSYRNLVPDLTYRMDAIIYLKETGEPLTDANGNVVTGFAEFTPSTPDGTVDVSIHLDTNYVMSLVENGTLNAPVDLVCFEQCSFAASGDVTDYHQWYDDNPVAVHEQINDEGQTVRVGEISTGVYDNQTLSRVASDGPDGDGYAVIVDRVHYEGLQPGTTYTMQGSMHLLRYDDDGNAIDGGVIEGADSREVLHPSTTFIPEDHEGYVDVTYVINVNRFRGETMVSFEICKQNGVTIMWHEDIEDVPQTLFVPDVHTNAYCPDTTPGEMGRTVIGLDQRARIVDEVNYENLLVDGREYMIQGCLYWMYTDDNGNIHSGPMSDIIGEAQAVSTILFVPDQQDGTVEMTFTFDSTVLSDLHYDRIVVCESIFANGGIGWKRIANHWDFRYENNSQSIYVADVHTTATTQLGNVLPEQSICTVTDRVFYENLVPGTEYTLVGNVQYAITDAAGVIIESGALIQNGNAVTSSLTFVPESQSGFVDITFTVDASDIAGREYDRIVVFEELFVGPGVRIAVHADINDADQTIYIPALSSSAHGTDGVRSIAPVEGAVVVDTVYYTGLIPGREYRMETDLMNCTTGQSDSHVTTVFVPQTSDGSIDITINFDASGYLTEKLVVFESVYDHASGALIKSHRDWNEKSQTITLIPQTGLTYDPIYRDVGYSVASSGGVLAMLWFVASQKRKERL